MFIELAHSYWKKIITPEAYAIDATVGNGFDTLFLASLHPKGIFALDIQDQAIESTKRRLKEHLSEEELLRISLYTMSHTSFPEAAKGKNIKLIAYNLGYLPRSDKKVKTLAPSTLQSLENALPLLAPGGMISVMCYPGHEEGKEEESSVSQWAKHLDPLKWTSLYHTQPNKPLSPTLLLLYKII